MAEKPWYEWIEKRLLGTTRRERAAKRYNEGYADGYNDGGEDEPVSGTLARYGYRQSSTQGRNFELAGFKEVLKIGWQYFQSSPLAKRLMTIKRDYIMGKGIKPRSNNDKIDKVVKKFWKENKLKETRSKEFVLQLFLLGSQIYPVFVRKADGRVRLGYIDPEQIEQVVTHPDNGMDQYAVIIQETQTTMAWEKPQKKRAFRIIREAEGTVVVDKETQEESVQDSENEGRLVTADQVTLESWEEDMLKSFGLAEYSGSCFYTKVNSVSNHPYGYSDLSQGLDWIDQLDAVLFALADRERSADYFSFDVAIDGNPEQVAKRAEELAKNPPKKGSLNVHTKDEVWTLHAPMLHQTQSVSTVNAILTFVLGGLGYPRHWYGHGDYTNRATADAQADPSWRSLEHDQGIVHDMFLGMCKFAVDQAIIGGGSGITDDAKAKAEIILEMPEMSIKDISSVAGIFHNILFALAEATQNQWVTADTVMKVIAKIMDEMGVKFDPVAEKEEIKANPPPPPILKPIQSGPADIKAEQQRQEDWIKRLDDIDLRYADAAREKVIE